MVRSAALWALGDIEDPSVLPVVRRATSDPSEVVRGCAESVFSRPRRRRFAPRHPGPPSAETAAFARLILGTARAEDISCLRDVDVRRGFVSVFQAIANGYAATVLVTWLIE